MESGAAVRRRGARRAQQNVAESRRLRRLAELRNNPVPSIEVTPRDSRARTSHGQRRLSLLDANRKPATRRCQFLWPSTNDDRRRYTLPRRMPGGVVGTNTAGN
jgi:hypothetical protein